MSTQDAQESVRARPHSSSPPPGRMGVRPTAPTRPSAGPCDQAPSADGTIWYMGAKTRVLGALEGAIGPLLRRAGRRADRAPVLLDLFTGTGVVAAHFASRAQLVLADAQSYAVTVAAAAVLGEGPQAAGRGVAGGGELEARFWQDVEAAQTPLRQELRGRLREERAVLAAVQKSARGRLAPGPLARFRKLAANGPSPAPEAEAAALRAKGIPACLVACYYGQVYFSLQQAVQLDALRFAIGQLPDGPVRTRALAALLFAASRATSATAHFAQPRALGRDSEVRGVARRQAIDIASLFRARAEHLRRLPPAAWPPVELHAAPYPEVFRALEGRPVDVVYADPPYTQDNYSRFYHVLEVLVGYDYPPLGRRGHRLLKGRYPERGLRFQSGFTHRTKVEGEFERVTALARRAGAALVWSYSETNGLLVERVYEGDLSKLEALLAKHYRRVRMERVPVLHSGAGDNNHRATELVIACTGPR